MTGWIKLATALAIVFVTVSDVQAQCVEEYIDDAPGYYEPRYVPAPVYVARPRVVRVSYAAPVYFGYRGGYRGGFGGYAGYRGGFGGYRGGYVGYRGGFGGYRGGFGGGYGRRGPVYGRWR